MGSFDLGSFEAWLGVKKDRCLCDPIQQNCQRSKIIQKLRRPLTDRRSAMIDLSPYIIKVWWVTRDLSLNPPFGELHPPPPCWFSIHAKKFWFSQWHVAHCPPMIRDQNVELNNELFSFRSYIYQRMQVDRIHIFDNGVPFFEVFCFASKMVRIATKRSCVAETCLIIF